MSQYAHLSNADPEFEPLLKVFQPPPDWSKLPATANQNFVVEQFIPMIMNHRSPKLPPESTYRVEDHQIPVEGGEVTIRCLTPTPAGASKDQTFPLLFWLHGGGYTMLFWLHGGGYTMLDLDDFLLRRVCVELQISVVNINYRLAPEYPWPTGLNDCYDGLKWVASHPEVLSASLEKGFIIGGQSAGANYAVVMAIRARDDAFFEGKRITGQLLQAVHVIHAEAYPEKYKDQLLSMEQNKNMPILDRSSLDDFYNRLQPVPTDPEFSPLLASSHAGLPPAYFQICGMDPFRDDGFLYQKILNEAGVPTKCEVYPGVPHCFHLLWPQLKQAIKYDKDMMRGLQWLLSRS